MKKPVAVWTYAPFSMWGSLSALRTRRRSAPPTIRRDPWWAKPWAFIHGLIRWLLRR